MKRKGVFVTIEGPEGSGKTTIARMLEQRLQKMKIPVRFTIEPGDSAITAKIREILLEPKREILSPLTELFLFEADRAQHVSSIIRPALQKGKLVLCVRFDDSTTAYQGYGRGLDVAMIKKLNRIATGGLKPDLTILIDIDPRLGLKRAKRSSGRLDRMERERKTFHKKIREGYLKLAKQEPRRFVLISGAEKKHIVEEKTWKALKKFLKRTI